MRRALKAWNVEVCVFGHTPEALGPEGVTSAKGKRLVRVDVGINPLYDYSKGAWLEIRRDGGEFAFTAHRVEGDATPLFRKKLLSSRETRALDARGSGDTPCRKAE